MALREVLVTDGHSGRGRDAVGAIRGLAAGGYLPSVTVAKGYTSLGQSRLAKRKIRVPSVEDSNFAEKVRLEVAQGNFLAVLPASEDAFEALKSGTSRLTVKSSLESAAAEAGLETPPSRTFPNMSALKAASGELSYPVVLKPDVRRFPARLIKEASALNSITLDSGPLVVQPFLFGDMKAVSGVMWRGRLVAAVHERWERIWPPDCGLASWAISVHPDEEIEDRLVKLLGEYEGVFSSQFVGRFLIDVNLRVHSTHSLGVASGVNLAAIYCDLLSGLDVDVVRARPGHVFRWLEGDVRHVASALRARKLAWLVAARAMKPVRGAAHSIESVSDPGPLIARIIRGAVGKFAHDRSGVGERRRAKGI